MPNNIKYFWYDNERIIDNEKKLKIRHILEILDILNMLFYDNAYHCAVLLWNAL